MDFICEWYWDKETFFCMPKCSIPKFLIHAYKTMEIKVVQP